jgi:hypothetical protein
MQSAPSPQPPDTPALPTLEAGVTLLETDTAPGPLQSLVLDHLLVTDGAALWVDSKGRATTTALGRLAPSRRLLGRISVARGFTPYQHYSLVQTLRERLVDAADDVALVVVPVVDHQYRTEELRGLDGAELCRKVAHDLAAIATDHDVPVLVTRAGADELSRPIADMATETITCEQTQFGPRFTGSAFETLVYRDGQYIQTTLAFWAEVLAERATAEADTTEVAGVGAY